MDTPMLQLKAAKVFVNECLKNKEPWEIVTITSTTVLASVWTYHFLFQPQESLFERSKACAFRMAKKIPFVANKLNSELQKIAKSFEDEQKERSKTVPFITTLPKDGKTEEEILKLVDFYLNLGDYDWEQGKVSGSIYYHDKNLINLLTQVYGKASYTNPLHPEVFPGVCKMEAEVVRMTADLFHGDEKTCGTMTTGGTESILMAVKAYRDFARAEKGVRYPEMILATTAHPAFDKGARYFGVRTRYIDVDPETTSIDVKRVRRAINSNTIMIVASMPNFPYGTMDNVTEIAKLGVRYNVPVHVDACLGGFIVAFMEKAGFDLPPFDFAVSGVTSISADTHKYGFAPKGSSVILYSDKKYRHHQYTVTTDWTGGVYGSPTVNGSRAGGIIAACWATLMHFGLDGYVQSTKQIVDVTKFIEAELRKMDGLFVFGKPISSVIAIGSNKFHIYRLSEALGKRGWNLNPLQFPPGVHLCVTHLHTQPGVAQGFVNDVKEELAVIMKNPELPVEGKLAMYGMSASVPDRSIVGDFTRFFLDSMYYTPVGDKQITNGLS